MPRRKPDLPICEHIALGAELTQMQERVVKISVQLSNAYPVSSRAVDLARRVDRALNALRCELDSVSARENPGDDNWAPNIYYGANHASWERAVPPILTRHQAGDPACCRNTGAGQ